MRSIFFSWQSETKSAVNRDLIHDALQRATKRLSVACEVDEATRGVSGSPAIFETLLSKITRCSAFIGDLTLVMGSESRKSCNPNVLIEYGYALARPGERYIVPVVNRHFGSPELLPFDLRHKAVRAIYNLSPEASTIEIEAAGQELENLLFMELQLIFESPGSLLGLSDNEVAVAEHIIQSSKRGRGHTYYKTSQLAEATGVEQEAVERAVAELVSREYLRRLSVSGTDSPPVAATPFMFWNLDLYVHGWNPRDDARSIAQALVRSSNTGHGHLATKEFAKKEGWSIRRLNPALRYLVTSSIVRESKEVDPDVVTLEIYENDATRAFLRGEYDPDSRRRGAAGDLR
jgi:hypothetical protein